VRWLSNSKTPPPQCPAPSPDFPDPDGGISRHADPEEIDRARTWRLVATLFRMVRLTLAVQPSGCENIYIPLDAVASVAAIVLVKTEDRDAFDFFTLALTQNLDRLEARNSKGRAAEVASPVTPKLSQERRRIRHERRYVIVARAHRALVRNAPASRGELVKAANTAWERMWR
jgi:hypothetical protein